MNRGLGCLILGALVGTACSKEQPPTTQTALATAAVTAAPAASSAPAKALPALKAPPAALGTIKAPADNPTTPAKVALGQKLFFDKALSVDGTLACYSCHLNEDGTGGHDPVAIGAGQKKLPRHAPPMWNVGYLPALYWDGRSATLEAQATAAWAGGNMGVGKDNLLKKADEIGLKPEYEALFSEAFPGEGATPDTIVKAISAYERTLTCGETAWDKFSGGDAAALTDEQKQGWELFRGDKAGCASCHTPPFFSDAYLAAGGAYHNAGVGFEGKKEAEVDAGRQATSKSDSDFGAFKTPSLRNISKTAPYFHDGSVATLEAAVRFMAGGGFKNKNLDPKFVDRKLSDTEIKALVAFLGSLSCEGSLVAP